MKMTSSKRFAVRTALVTGTTLATIIGAQALASLDEAASSKAMPPVIAPSDLLPQSTGSTPVIVLTSEAPAAAPDIVILRHAGQVSTVQPAAPQPGASIPNTQPVVIQPPNPVQVAVPQPVAQPVPQQGAPVVARTRSSR